MQTVNGQFMNQIMQDNEVLPSSKPIKTKLKGALQKGISFKQKVNGGVHN
jgi:hypothetical protein